STGTGAAGTVAFALSNYAWQQSNRPVQPNTLYKFRMKVTNWKATTDAPGPNSLIKVLINGQDLDLHVVGSSVTTKTYEIPDYCAWHYLEAEWPSGSNTSATITIAEVGKDNAGHEFAMDEISFGS